MSTAIIYVKYESDQMYVSNDNSTWSKDCTFETDVDPNGKIEWDVQTAGVVITSMPTSDPDGIFKKAPYEKKGVWQAQMDKKESGEATYDIDFSFNGVEQPSFDPIIAIKPPKI